ncbi:hypothetical protein BJ508DRAFT_339923 [Ascobolus immersus RN42]|uniref:Uncharacterized protein n=1 Tax=Ascobolus immersus RN42 TaxID=1160509 RepID=A0A3N4IG23_ASCIM|nr:hypothetical protein BJ508DRAFT_339923 [Ascobolus immersus RN42]
MVTKTGNDYDTVSTRKRKGTDSPLDGEMSHLPHTRPIVNSSDLSTLASSSLDPAFCYNPSTSTDENNTKTVSKPTVDAAVLLDIPSRGESNPEGVNPELSGILHASFSVPTPIASILTKDRRACISENTLIDGRVLLFDALNFKIQWVDGDGVPLSDWLGQNPDKIEITRRQFEGLYQHKLCIELHGWDPFADMVWDD